MEADPALDLKRRLNILVVLTVVLYLIVGGLTVFTYVRAESNREALCTFRADLDRRVNQSKELLIRNPVVVRRFGLTQAQVRAQIMNQEATLKSLSGLNC